MQTKLFAKNPATGLYFDGAAFNATKEAALELRPGTTADDFKLAWSAPVEIEIHKDASRTFSDAYIAAIMEHSDKYQQARHLVRSLKRSENRVEFFVKNGKDTMQRKVRTDKDCAFARIKGQDVSLILDGGILTTDRIVE